MKRAVALLCSSVPWILLSNRATEVVHVPKGNAVNIERTDLPNEWDDAGLTQISVAPEWTVKVRFKHDEENLDFAFEDTKHGRDRLFPEIFIDPLDEKSSRWQKGQWWFHVSQNLCEGDGEPNVYTRNGV